MISSERSRILPLRISSLITFADRDPSTLASGYSRSLVRFVEPRHNARRFRPVAGVRFVVVGQGAVKRVLPRSKPYRQIISSMRGVRIVKPPVIFRPFFVPRTLAIRREIVSTRLFADPKNCCHDACLPRVALGKPGYRWFSGARFLFQRFGLSSEASVESNKECETKRGNSAAFPHDFAN